MMCSLRPLTSFVPPVRRAYFTDLAPLMSYICAVVANPCRSPVACAKPCLRVLNAAEPSAAEPAPCTSGVSDGLELVRQTAGPVVARLLGLYGL